VVAHAVGTDMSYINRASEVQQMAHATLLHILFFKKEILSCVAVTLGAFSLGNVLAWSSPTQEDLEITLGTTAWSWVGALMALGAAVVVIPIGYLIDKIGRKYTMLALVLPFTAGWALIAWAEDSVSV
jgi:SP family facilitated glucose transporter-like MFS transporter 8